MSRTTTTVITASLCWGGDIQTGEAEVTAQYTVVWGAPARGPSYASGGEPADPDEIVDVRILILDGRPWSDADWRSFGRTREEAHDTLAEKLIDDCEDEMIGEAVEQDGANMEAALEARSADYD